MGLSHEPEQSSQGVIESHKRPRGSREARGKTRGSLVSQNRLVPSPGPEGSHEEAPGSHERLSPSQEEDRKTQQSGRAGKDSCRVLDPGGAVRESWRAIMGSVRVKEHGVRLSRAWRAGEDSCRVLDQRGAVRESWGATMGSVRVKKRGGRLSRAGEPGKTHAES